MCQLRAVVTGSFRELHLYEINFWLGANFAPLVVKFLLDRVEITAVYLRRCLLGFHLWLTYCL